MSESTQAFLLGISAALGGLLLYLCVSFAGPIVLGGAADAGTVTVAEAQPPAPQPAGPVLAGLTDVEEEF